MSDLRTQAQTWHDHDPDADTKRELEAVLADPTSAVDLAERFACDLEFGTAGLRGVLGAGPNRMNLAVVLRTTFGVAKVLDTRVHNARTRGVVIGYDGRRKSQVFAQGAAEVLAALGFDVYLFDEVGPTPLLAFALSKLGCAAGIMVTASHNPPEYNGYKLYWENGAQIIPPLDGLIAAAITGAPFADQVPRAIGPEAHAFIKPVPREIEQAYQAGVQAVTASSDAKDTSLKIIYTAMHGVGAKLMLASLRDAGFSSVHSVGEQEAPNGEFPTVKFPNPEEKGAMDLAFALAKEVGAHLVLANDPDADRLAVALPSGDGNYVQLTGNQVGILLGTRALELTKAPKPFVLNSCVSSPMLGAIARAHGATFEETLTGFKWIANRAIEREKSESLDFIFGYEEALGYTVGTLVRDKDGISAGLFMANLAAKLRAEGKTLWDDLERITRRYGLYASSQLNITRKGISGAAELSAMMNGLRQNPPKTVAGIAVIAFSDFEAGTRTTANETARLTLPPSNVLVFELAGGHRVIARPSGTEPKAKFYFDVCEPVADGEALAGPEARAQALLRLLEADFSKAAGASS